MTTVLMNRHHLVGTGYAEMCHDGRRYRFKVERYVDDAGEEWGRIVEQQEIPDVGPQLWVPSYNIEAAEAQYLSEEFEHEKKNPHPLDVEWWGEQREGARRRMALYDELRDARAEHIRRNPVTKGRG